MQSSLKAPHDYYISDRIFIALSLLRRGPHIFFRLTGESIPCKYGRFMAILGTRQGQTPVRACQFCANFVRSGPQTIFGFDYLSPVFRG